MCNYSLLLVQWLILDFTVLCYGHMICSTLQLRQSSCSVLMDKIGLPDEVSAPCYK